MARGGKWCGLAGVSGAAVLVVGLVCSAGSWAGTPATPSASPSAASAAPEAAATASSGLAPAASASAAPAATDDPELEQARKLFHQGNELRRAGDCQKALELYQRSRAIRPSVPNIWNSAICLDALGRHDEALETYELLLTDFRNELTDQDRGFIRPAVEQLRARLGSLDIVANVEGLLVVDGRMRGKLPLSGPVRLMPGRHIVQVMKEGYATHESEPVITVGRTSRLDVRLEVLASGGRLRVEAAGLEGGDVLVDGAAVGVVPWEGTLEPGAHRLVVRKGDRGTAPQLVTVVKGQLVRVSAQPRPLGPEMRIGVEPATAEIVIDDVAVGRGLWQGRLPLGKHRIRAHEEGYVAALRELTVDPQQAGDTTLRLEVDAEHPRWGAGEAGHVWLELHGGVALAPSLGSDAEASCERFSCSDDGWATGVLVGARGGWEFPVGVSLGLGVGYLRLQKSLERNVAESFTDSATDTVVPTTYGLADSLRARGPYVGAHVGYRQPVAEILELKAGLLVGAFFSFTSDTISGTAAASGGQRPVTVDGSAELVRGADLLLAPEIDFGVRVSGFGVGLGLAAVILPVGGPSLATGDVRVVGPSCTSATTAIDCAPGESFAAGEAAYGTMVALVPTLSLGYLF